MYFLFVVLYIAPPLISVFLYERMCGYKLSNPKRAALYFIFSLFITAAGVAALWFMGWGYQVFIPDSYGIMTGLSYVLLYFAVSLAVAVALPHAVCLLKAQAATEDVNGSKGAIETTGQEDN